MNVTRGQIVDRGLTHRCPNCGARTLFVPGRWFSMQPACTRCGMRWDWDEGAFLGSATLNYGVTVFGLILPGIFVALTQDVPGRWIVAGAAAATFIIPLLLYRPSKSWWLMCYYFFLPHHLPANREAGGEASTALQ